MGCGSGDCPSEWEGGWRGRQLRSQTVAEPRRALRQSLASTDWTSFQNETLSGKNLPTSEGPTVPPGPRNRGQPRPESCHRPPRVCVLWAGCGGGPRPPEPPQTGPGRRLPVGPSQGRTRRQVSCLLCPRRADRTVGVSAAPGAQPPAQLTPSSAPVSWAEALPRLYSTPCPGLQN